MKPDDKKKKLEQVKKDEIKDKDMEKVNGGWAEYMGRPTKPPKQSS